MVGHLVDGREGFVGERFRLKGTIISMNRLRRTLRIRYTRIKHDGTDELIEGSVG